mmetsp:Transcript_4725/g.13379  ORF Transcript_4725/g.13379 Transcript_4725/m.13379 type:complete len:97 (-) Transcript_4725:657-947(-)
MINNGCAEEKEMILFYTAPDITCCSSSISDRSSSSVAIVEVTDGASMILPEAEDASKSATSRGNRNSSGPTSQRGLFRDRKAKLPMPRRIRDDTRP